MISRTRQHITGKRNIVVIELELREITSVLLINKNLKKKANNSERFAKTIKAIETTPRDAHRQFVVMTEIFILYIIRIAIYRMMICSTICGLVQKRKDAS